VTYILYPQSVFSVNQPQAAFIEYCVTSQIPFLPDISPQERWHIPADFVHDSALFIHHE